MSMSAVTRAALAVAVAAVALQAAPAAAAPEAPVLTGPTGLVSGEPELTWEPVAGAVGYEVQVDDSADFSSPEWQRTTDSTVSVPTSPLAAGRQHVQVRAKDSSGTWSPWSGDSFTVSLVPGPDLLGSEHRLLSWSPVPGAIGYTVEVDTEDAFITPAAYQTVSTSLVLPESQVPGVTYRWRVRATLATGVFSDYSQPGSFEVPALDAPVVLGPGNDEDVTDVVLDWAPVPGATHYELQVDDDADFSSLETGVPSTILGTRFSPKITFGNDQYYWRVRAVDPDKNKSAWSERVDGSNHEFDRVWEDVPTPLYPAGDDLQRVGDDLYYEWTPVPHASHYEVWVSTDPYFTEPSPTTWQCQVVGTTYTPGEVDPKDDCMPKAEGITHYWKVRPLDAPYPGGVEGIFSPTQRFVYNDASSFRILTPVHGSTVSVPTLDWEPVDNVERYEVELLDGRGSSVDSETTHSTSYTPRTKLEPAQGPYTWLLTARDAAGRVTERHSRSFTLAEPPPADGTALTPVSAPATYDAPRLRWAPHPDAEYYTIAIGDAEAGGFFTEDAAPILKWKTAYPTATDISTRFLGQGRYHWYVRAYDEETGLLADGRSRGLVGTFEVKGLDAVTGHRLALTGSGLDRGDACVATLPDVCDALPATPVLDWEPVPYASFYRVHISKDGNFTTGPLATPPPETAGTRWAPRVKYPKPALADSQASTPYFWFIQPCKSANLCGPDPRSVTGMARHAFRKTSPRLTLISPAHESTVDTTEVTFTWRDYLETNRSTVYPVTGEASTQSAAKYEIQVDDDPTFATPLDKAVVDQTTYTSSGRLYPEGPLYWRVQPIDAAENFLGWSQTWRVDKRSPRPTLLSPLRDVPDPDLTGSVPFTWQPQPFAASYVVQVAQGGDTNFSAANLVVNRTSTRPAYTPGADRTVPLPPSVLPYKWRVQRRDASSELGPWSEVGSFYVAPSHPALVSPEAAEVVGPRNLVLRWARVPEASRYRVHYRVAGSTRVTTAVTSAGAFAPTTALTVDATYEWRVEALDVDNQVIGSSEARDGGWRRFTVGGPPRATTPASIAGSPVLGSRLTVAPATWSVPGVVETYQWLRGGTPIPEATGSSYVVDVPDVGKQLTVRVTGSSPEFGTGTSLTAAVTGQPGPGAQVVTPPQISGSGKVGTPLTSTPASWDAEGVVVTHQWLRNGTAIPGATNPTYTVAAADVSAEISLRVSGAPPGRLSTTATSNSVTGQPGDAPVGSPPAAPSGTARPGGTLTAPSVTWSLTGVVDSWQWLRDGQPVTGQTGRTYTVAAGDPGSRIAVRITGTRSGHTPATVTSGAVTIESAPPVAPPPVVVPPTVTQPPPTTPAPVAVASTTILKAPAKVRATQKAGVRVTVLVTVRATGATPGGTVQVHAGRKLVGTGTLTANGTVKLRLKKLTPGRYKLRARYLGAAPVTASASRTLILKVVR